MAIASKTTAERGQLADLVRRHEVVYEVYPHKSVVRGRELSIGFDVELLGIHVGGTHGVRPGCERCVGVWEDLRKVAEAVVPDEIGRVSAYEVQPFDAALHFSRGGGRGRENVRAVLSIRHRRDALAGIDPCEEHCLHEIVRDLTALGAREKEWTDAPSPFLGA